MVPRRVLLDRLLDGFPADRIRRGRCVVAVSDTGSGVRVEFDDGSEADGDAVVGADGLHSAVRDIVGAAPAVPTGWCSWQGLAPLSEVPDRQAALVAVGENGNLGVWPAGGTDVQWWFDLPWSADFVRPDRPLETIRSHFTGWSDVVDRILESLTDEALTHSPYPHFRHPVPGPGRGPITLLGDAAHTMPPTLAQGTNQALLDTMVLCKELADCRDGDVARALRAYERTRRWRVKAVSRVASLQVSHGEAVLKPAASIPDRVMTRALTLFLASVSHRKIAAQIDRDLAARTSAWP
jgi:FAD-dependent urate hydroxylase